MTNSPFSENAASESNAPANTAAGPITNVVPDAAATASGTPKKSKNPPLFATILWGVLLIAFAGFVVVWSVLDIATDPTIWIIIGLIGAGLLLVVAGIVASLRRAG